MSKKNNKIFMTVLIVAAAVFLFSGCGGSGEQVVEERKVPVETVKAEKGSLVKLVVLSGTAEADVSVSVVPEIMSSQQINGVAVSVGDRVQEGDVLISLDREAAAIQLSTAQVSFDDAARNLERNKALYEAGAVSKSVFEQVSMAYTMAENSLHSAQLSYDNSLVTAPVGGTVTAVNAETGNLASPGVPLAVIENIDNLEIGIAVNEMLVNSISEGQEVNILIPAVQKTFSGRIESISPSMTLSLKAYAAEISFANEENVVKPGMYGEVEIVTEAGEDVLVVPAQAVLTLDGEEEIYIVEDGVAVRRDVKTGLSDGHKTEIVSGLAEGEEVIFRGNENILAGDAVAVQDGEK